jgi:hypothetical protein
LNKLKRLDQGRTFNYYVGLVLVLYLGLQVILAISLPLIHDEALKLQISRLINQGYRPYAQIFTLDYPLFVTFLGWFQLPPLGFRLLFLGFSLLLLINVVLITRFWFDEKVALATLLLLATATTFLAEATQVNAVIPALSLALLSLVLVCRYLQTGQHFWVLGGGLLWGFTLFISRVTWSLALVPLLFILLAPACISQKLNLAGRRRTIIPAISLWLAGAAIAIFAGIFLATPTLIFDHLFKDYSQIRAAFPASPPTTFKLMGQFLAFNLWLFLFASYALVELYQKPDHPLWVIVLWGLLSFAWLMTQTNLASQEIALLLPPLAMIAGWGLVQGGGYVLHFANFGSEGSWAWFRIALLLLVYILISLQQFQAFQIREFDTASDLAQVEHRQEIADYIAQLTKPEGCVIIDDAALAVAANRLPAPELLELSETRILSGLLSEKQLIDLFQEKDCQAVVFSKREQSLHLAGFQGLLSAYYPHEGKIIQTRIYYR